MTTDLESAAKRQTMDNAAITSRSDEDLSNGGSSGPDQRAAPRFTLLIRAAKLIADQGEFVCVIRDVSETGVSVRLFHRLPKCKTFELQMPSGGQYEIRPVWERGNEAGFEFTQPVQVAKLITEAGEYPKRGLRLGLCFPIRVTTLTTTTEAIVENLSQQGARLVCDSLFAIDQNLRIDGEEMNEVRAKVRWRRNENYGVVFDDTFTLGDFARMAARLQAPGLLDE